MRERVLAPTTESRVAIVILNWNRWRDTITAVDSVLASTFAADEVVVVDNGSSDDSADQLIAYAERKNSEGSVVRVVVTGENLGFAGGCNAGYEAIGQKRCDFVLFLNNDAVLAPETLGELVSVARESRAAITAPLVFDGTGKRLLFSKRSWPAVLFGLSSTSGTPPQRWWKTDVVDGCAMLVHRGFLRERIERHGWVFDPSFFLYWEDVDLALDANANSTGCVTAGRGRVLHEVSASSGGVMNATSFYYLTRNRILLAQRWLSFPARVLFHLYYLPSRLVLQVVHRLKRGTGRAVWQAFIDGVADGYSGRLGPRPGKDIRQ